MNTAKKSSRKTSQASSDSETCGLQLTIYAAIDPGSSVADSLARTSQAPAKGRASKATDRICGGQCGQSSAHCDPIGCSLRMYLRSALEDLTMCSLPWKRSATPAGRSWWVLSMSELRTRGRESGLLPTPTASEYGSNQGGAAGCKGKKRPSLETVAKQWATPMAGDSENATRRRADGIQGTGWSTPSTRDTNDEAVNQLQNRRDDALPIQANVSMGGSSQERYRLNPDWVEQLMGYPVGWTNIE